MYSEAQRYFDDPFASKASVSMDFSTITSIVEPDDCP